jgi:polysaccharide pyruvyl transferase WcaK-like protein
VIESKGRKFASASTKPAKPKRIALFGNFGTNNFGNEASLRAMLDFVRRVRPDARLTCICYGTEQVQFEHCVVAVSITWPFPKSCWFMIFNRLLGGIPFHFIDFVRAFYLARSVDVFIVPGTGILDDFGQRWQQMPFDLFKWSIAAKLGRRRFAFVSIGAGPINNSVSRRLMTLAAQMADYRSYRDAASKAYMRVLGVGAENDPVFPDLVFSLSDPEDNSKTSPNQLPLTIGVGVMNYSGWSHDLSQRQEIHNSYVAKMSEFTCLLLQRGYHVRLLMGARSDEQMFDIVLRCVIARCGNTAATQVTAEPTRSLTHLLDQILKTDLVVATRFHNIVAALKAGKATISVGYARKNDELLALVGLDAFCQSADRIDVELLFAQFEKLLGERHKSERKIHEITAQFRKRLEDQNDYLLKWVL